MQIEQAKADAAKAKAEAAEANANALSVAQENIKLSGRISTVSATARTAEAALARANKDTSDFAHALQRQQGVMNDQAKLSPVLAENQIGALAAMLRGYVGQDVIVHSTLDTTVLRTKVSVLDALLKAGITCKQNTQDMGALYQGVSVAIHSPQAVPPFANSLVLGLRQAGIDVHQATESSIPAGQVGLYFGPN